MKHTALRASLGLALLLSPMAAAAALPPQDYDQAKDAARVHAQVEVTRLQPPPGEFGICEIEAVARRVFRGEPELRPEARLRFTLSCLRSGAPRGAAPVGPAAIFETDRLAAGTVLELYLNPAADGHEVPYHALAWWIANPTAEPLYPPQAEMQRRREALRAALAGGPDRPPYFPRQPVAVTYRVSTRPGEEFRALYAPGIGEFGAARFEVAGAAAAEATVVRPGPSPRQSLVNDAARSFRALPIRPTDRFALLARSPAARFQRLGEEQRAGRACTLWRIEEPGGAPAETACVTAEGIPLRRVSPEGEMEAVRVEALAPEEPRFDPAPWGYRFRGAVR